MNPFPHHSPCLLLASTDCRRMDKTFSSLCPGLCLSMGLDAYFLCLELSRGIPPLYPRSSLQPFTKGWAGNAAQIHPWLNTSAPATGSGGVQGVMILDFFACQKGIRKTKKMLSSELAASTRSISLGYLSCSCTLL